MTDPPCFTFVSSRGFVLVLLCFATFMCCVFLSSYRRILSLSVPYIDSCSCNDVIHSFVKGSVHLMLLNK